MNSLMASIDNFNLSNGRLQDVIDVASELRSWLTKFTINPPGVVIRFSEGFLELSIGDFPVWSDQSDSWEGLTLANIKKVYCTELLFLLAPFDRERECQT